MFLIKNILSYLIILPLIGVFGLLMTPSHNQSVLKSIFLNVSCLTFVVSLVLWVFFNKSIGTFQFVDKFLWIPIINLNFVLGIDGISVFFVLLTTLLIPICLLIGWDSIVYDRKKIFFSVFNYGIFSYRSFLYTRLVTFLCFF